MVKKSRLLICVTIFLLFFLCYTSVVEGDEYIRQSTNATLGSTDSSGTYPIGELIQINETCDNLNYRCYIFNVSVSAAVTATTINIFNYTTGISTNLSQCTLNTTTHSCMTNLSVVFPNRYRVTAWKLGSLYTHTYSSMTYPVSEMYLNWITSTYWGGSLIPSGALFFSYISCHFFT